MKQTMVLFLWCSLVVHHVSAQNQPTFSVRGSRSFADHRQWAIASEWQWSHQQGLECSVGHTRNATDGYLVGKWTNEYVRETFVNIRAGFRDPVPGESYRGTGRPLPASGPSCLESSWALQLSWRRYYHNAKKNWSIILQPGIMGLRNTYLRVQENVNTTKTTVQSIILPAPVINYLERTSDYITQVRRTDRLTVQHICFSYHLAIQRKLPWGFHLEARIGRGIHLGKLPEGTDKEFIQINRFYDSASLALGWTLPAQWLRASKKA